MAERFLSTRAVGWRLGLTDTSVRGIAPEELPYIVVGRRGVHRYRARDVERYLVTRQVVDAESSARLVRPLRGGR